VGAQRLSLDKEQAMTIEFTLPDMTCGHCAMTVTATVQQLDPAAQLQIDLPTHKVVIESTQTAQALAAALAQEGYPPA
jgi:copper chaperone